MPAWLTVGALGAAILSIWSVAQAGGEDVRSSFSSHVSSDGRIHLPEDFRGSMVHLGSWFVPEGEASGFHDVYTERASIDAYRRTGRFPDGATLVKELRSARSADYTTGAGVSHATAAIKQWFVMIKDEQGRFPNSGSWGNGWGWALFKPDDPGRNVSSDFRRDCLGCHAPAQASDWVYIEAYPTLNAEKP